jgi:hypothetical protein
VAAAGGLLATTVGHTASAAEQDDHHQHDQLNGALANATVSFGAWPQPLDRLNLPVGAPPPNVHQLIPFLTTIKAGGTVNFIVAGFHNIAIYGPGTKPEDIDSTIRIDVPGAPPGFPQLINDDRNRVFRGAAGITVPQDRVEVVQFPKRGLYLVICAFLPHFLDEMWGYVRVVR